MAESFEDLLKDIDLLPGGDLEDFDPSDPGVIQRLESESMTSAFGVPRDSPMDVVATATPQRFGICEWERPMDAGCRFTATRNPTEFEQSVETEWNRFVSPGAGYAHMHFMATKNHVVELELYWNAFTDREAAEAERVRLMLISWCYPRRDAGGWSLGPPRLIATWPNMFSFECYLVECRVRNLAFALSGRSVRWIAQIKLEEAKDYFLGSSVVRRHAEDGPSVDIKSIPSATKGGKSKKRSRK